MKKVTITPVLLFFIAGMIFSTNKSFGQAKPITMAEAVNTALKNNLQLQGSNLAVKEQLQLQKTAVDIPKTEATIQTGSAAGGDGNSLSVLQPFAFPTVYRNNAKLLQAQTQLSEKQRDIVVFDITRQVKLAYTYFQFNFERIKLLTGLDSIYAKFRQRAELRQQTGETSNLEKYAAQNKFYEIQLQIKQARIDKNTALLALQKLLNTREDLVPADTNLIKIPLNFVVDTSLTNHPQTAFYAQQVNVAKAALQLEKSRFLPDFNVGTTHTLSGAAVNSRGLGFQAGVAIPLFYGAQKARTQAAKTNTQLMETQAQAAKLNLQTQYQAQYNEYLKQKEGLDYYEQVGIKQADEIIRISQVSYKLGEIGYVEYIQNLTMAFDTKLKYLDAMNLYNQSIIQLNYITTGQ